VNVDVLLHDIQTVDTDAVAVGFFEDVRPLKGAAGALDWLLCGALSRLVLENRLQGALGEVALLTSSGKVPAGKVFLFGLGSRQAMVPGSLQAAARSVASSLAGAGVRRAAMDFFPLNDEGDALRLSAIRQGLREGAGGYALSLSLLAHDPVSFERMSRALRP
jgi:hypothetical protein